MKKRTFLLLLLAILLASGLGMLVVEHQGYVLITWKNIRFESTLWIFLACLAILGGALLVLKMLLGALLGSLGWVNPWSTRNRKKRLDNAVANGMLEYSRGNWQPALRQLVHAAKNSPQPLPYLLSAARAAEKMQQCDTADKLLSDARARLPENDLAISLCRAELLEQRGELASAQQQLEEARRHHAGNPELLQRLHRLLQANKDWGGLIGLLPDLRKSKALPDVELNAPEHRAWQGRLQAVRDVGELKKIWGVMSASLHKHAPTVLAYCSQLITLGQAEEASELLEKQLKQNVDVQLLQAFAQIPHKDAARALESGERWLAQKPDDALALFAVGRLAVQAQEWAQARDYFQRSLEYHPTPQVYAELARLLNQMGDHKAGNELLANGIRLLEQQAARS